MQGDTWATGGRGLAAAVTDDSISPMCNHRHLTCVPALSLLCHHPPWTFFEFILGERAKSDGKQMLIFRVGLLGGGEETSNATALRNVEGGTLSGASGLRSVGWRRAWYSLN